MAKSTDNTVELIRAKFTEFVTGLVELYGIKDTFYEPLRQKVSVTLDTLKENGKYDLPGITGLVTFDPEDSFKVLSTDILVPEGEWWDAAHTLKALTSMCNQVKACNVPEPEVLISEKGPTRLTYKLSREWINWHQNIFPEYKCAGGVSAAAWYAGRKHFMRGPADRISHEISPLAEQQMDGDVEVKFFRTIREEL